MVEWTACLHDSRFATIALIAFMGIELGLISWQAMPPYNGHGFGFGPPQPPRLPHPQFEGYTFVSHRYGRSSRKRRTKSASAWKRVLTIGVMRNREQLHYAQPDTNYTLSTLESVLTLTSPIRL